MPDMVDMSLGERVRALREAKEWTQADLVREVMELGRDGVKVSVSALSRIEGGSRRPSPRVVTALAVALGVQPDMIETGGNAWTGVYADGTVAVGTAPTAAKAVEKMTKRGELLALFPGRQAVTWKMGR